MPSLIQRSFAGGEIAPALYARADQVKYQTGLRTLRNFIVQRYGGVTNRPGTRFLDEVKDSTKPTRLLKFSFNDTQTYAIEAGDLYFRFFKRGVRLGADAFLSWTDNTIGIAWSSGVAYTLGTPVDDAGVNYVCILAHTSAAGNEPGVGATWTTYWTANPKTYVRGDVVVSGGGYFACITDHVASAATNQPASLWQSGASYVATDAVTGADGKKYVCILNHTSSAANEPGVGTSWLTDWSEAIDLYWVNSPTYGAGPILEVVTPYAAEDLAALRYVETGDILTLVHPKYAPMELRRYADSFWLLAAIDFNPTQAPPTGIAITGTAGSDEVQYAVTAVTDDGLESLPGLSSLTGSGSPANLGVPLVSVSSGRLLITTSANHGYLDGDVVSFSGFYAISYRGVVWGLNRLNGNDYVIDVASPTTFYLRTIGSAAITTAPGGSVTPAGSPRVTLKTARNTTVALPSKTTPVTVTWVTVAGAREFNVYRRVNGIYAFIGTTTQFTLKDDGSILPDTQVTAPSGRTPFNQDTDYPSVVSFFQQRGIYAGTSKNPEKLWLSRINDFHNFAARSPAQDDDAFAFTLVGRQVNGITQVLDLGKMVILTSGGEWAAEGDASGELTPTSINLKQQGYNGASTLDPIVIGNSALYVQARGGIVRDLQYSFNTDGFASRDLTLYADHLFIDHTIVDWDYAQIPHSVAWAVRDDGALLGLTYVRDQEILGWHRHDTATAAGTSVFESIVCVPEGNEDAVYVIVKRVVNGATKRYVERFATRVVTHVAVDAYFVDCGLSYDGTNTTATTLALTGGTTWAKTEDLTLTASASLFASGDVGNAFILQTKDSTGAVTDYVICTVLAFTSDTVVTVHADKTVPVAFRAAATAVWIKAVASVSGLGHLEGETVSVLGDGNVETGKVVTGGAITLSRPYGVIHAGLPIVADFETLDLEIVNGETLTDKRKRVGKVTTLVEASRGMQVGQDVGHLVEWKQRATEAWGSPIALFTGPVEIVVDATWNTGGRVFIRQDDPLPLTILSIVPSGVIGG